MGEYKYGLFDCWSNPQLSILACFFPCIITGQNSESAGLGNCVIYGFLSLIPIYNCYLNYQLRKLSREIVGAHTEFRSLSDKEKYDDLMVSLLFSYCSQVQIRRQSVNCLGETLART